MKILSVEKYYFITGGASRVFFETNELLEKKGHQVIPFAGRYPGNFSSVYARYFVPRFTMFLDEKEAKASLGQYIKAYFDALYAFDVSRSVQRLIADLKPDIAHLHTILYQISPSIIQRLNRSRIPVVQTLHDFSLVCASRSLYAHGLICERCKRAKFYNILLQNCCHSNYLVSFMDFSAKIVHRLFNLYPGKVDVFISPSQFLKKKMVEWGLPEKKIVHISHFLTASRFPSPHFGHDDYFVFAGYLVKQKGIYTLLKAMKKVPKGRLVILGRGPDKPLIEKLIKESQLRNVEVMGFLEGHDLFRLIKNAMFLVFPSEWHETFGMGILEAFLLGKPVVASSIGAYPELVQPDKTGILFEPGNHEQLAEKINFLIRDEDKCISMGKAARMCAVNNYNEEIHYQKLMAVYERLAAD